MPASPSARSTASTRWLTPPTRVTPWVSAPSISPFASDASCVPRSAHGMSSPWSRPIRSSWSPNWPDNSNSPCFHDSEGRHGAGFVAACRKNTVGQPGESDTCLANSFLCPTGKQPYAPENQCVAPWPQEIPPKAPGSFQADAASTTTAFSPVDENLGYFKNGVNRQFGEENQTAKYPE